MKIVYTYPPNYEDIAQAFNITNNKGVIFTYGDTLYVPGGQRISIDKPLMKHEETHARQQKAMGVETWWGRFLADPEFRLSQELEAYREQYKAMGSIPFHERGGYLQHIANDLGGEIYGNIMTPEEALMVITEGITVGGTNMIRSSLKARKAKKKQRQNRKRGRK